MGSQPALVSVSIALSKYALSKYKSKYTTTPVHQLTLPSITGTHCTHPQEDDQAALIWVAG